MHMTNRCVLTLLAVLIGMSLIGRDQPTLRAADATTKPVEVKPQSTQKQMTVTVVDAMDGKPLPGVTVILRARGEYGTGPLTDEAGRVRLEINVPTTYVSILCRRDGYVWTAANWDWREAATGELPETFTIALPHAAKIAGRVVSDKGLPVAGAKVFINYWPDPEPGPQPTVLPRIPDYGENPAATTGADGRWSFASAPPDALDKLSFRIEHADFVLADRLPVPPPDKLLNGSAQSTVQAGFDITGRVVDGTGKPIENASITTVKEQRVVNDYGKSVRSDADGRFKLVHLPPQTVNVTITAKGFAPQIVPAKIESDNAQVNVTMQPGKTLRARIVDPDGKPLTGARLSIEGWRNINSLTWSGTSDSDGLAVMPDAPDDAISFSISKDGYRNTIRTKLTAADEPVVVTLRPESKIHGKVIDAQARQPIESFRLIAGFALWEGRPPFFSFDRAKQLTKGDYTFTFDTHDEVVASYARFEADGYRPVISPEIRGGNLEFNVEMTRAPDLTGAVTNPDGSPAAALKVWTIPMGSQVDFYTGGLEHFDDGFFTRTDSTGMYRFGPQPEQFVLFAYNDAGYAIVLAGPEQTNVNLKMSAWARLEGVYKPTGKPLANSSLHTFFADVRDPRSTFPKFQWQFPVTTGSDGRYVVPRVPHFNGEPAIVQIGTFGSDDAECRRWLPARFEPGKTTQLDVAGTGRTVAGKALPGSSSDAIEGSRGFILLTPALTGSAHDWPASISDAGKCVQPVYRTSVDIDGSFAFPDIPAGAYEYLMTIYSGSRYASGSGTLTVSEGAAGSTLDAGQWTYTRGDRKDPLPSAPDHLGQTFDGKPIHLKTYRGKYVVIFVWDSCSGSADAHLPSLNALGAALGSDPNVKLISINCDATSCGMIGVPHRPATLDDPAWLRGCITLSQELVRTQLYAAKWPAILIVSPVGKIVARDLDGKDVEARLRAAMEGK
jgi:protocatechuate 3,4-dioxygenase beta subunit